MKKLFWLVVAAVLIPVLSAQAAEAQVAKDFPLIGAWKVESIYCEVTGSTVKTEPYGAHPQGLIMFTPQGRMTAILVPSPTDSAGKPVTTPMVAYSGPYVQEGPGLVSYHPDISISDAFAVGSSTVRSYTIKDKDTVLLATLPAKDKDSNEFRTVLTWKRRPF